MNDVVMEKGLIEGKKKGRREGRREGKIDVARKMLLKGVDVSLIPEVSGLSEESCAA